MAKHGAFDELTHIKRIYAQWKHRQAMREAYKNIIWVSTDKTQDGKYPPRVNLVLDSRGNKKGYHSLTCFKQLFRENTGALTHREDNPATDNAGKVELLNAFFALVFKGNCTQTAMCTSMIWERQSQETMMELSTEGLLKRS